MSVVKKELKKLEFEYCQISNEDNEVNFIQDIYKIFKDEDINLFKMESISSIDKGDYFETYLIISWVEDGEIYLEKVSIINNKEVMLNNLDKKGEVK